MPEMDGWTVLRELKRDASLANIPVHMLTIVDDVSKGYQLGASSYMGKPLDRSRLLALLEAPAARTISNPPGSLEARALYSVLTQSALVINQTDSSQPQGGERP
jgi:DNA-binding response OmpR family regulator